MAVLIDILAAGLDTLRDVLPIAAVLIGFQLLVLRRTIPNFRRLLAGFAYVLVGLTLFLVGLQEALFPLGETMAEQLTSLRMGDGDTGGWLDYGWVYVFAAAIGFATTVAEPALIAVSLKAQDVSGGTVSARGLRIAVAVGVAFGVALGTLRIVTGTPLPYFIIAGYVIVIMQTLHCNKEIVPLAFDSGGVTTSTVTVPVVTALGLGLASTIPGRSPLLDGFGLIAFASLFPIMSVMGYTVLSEWMRRKDRRGAKEENAP
ncbi:MAG: DUF1538 domain-containing protein [Alphaproteobacteria bacterium]